jgi:hypothetical protein
MVLFLNESSTWCLLLVTATLCILKLGLNDSQVFPDLPSQTWVSHEARTPETTGAGRLLEQPSRGPTASKTLSAAAHEQSEWI